MSKYDSFHILSDFNSETTETTMSNFCDMCHLHNLVTDPTCYKNPKKISLTSVV